MEARTFYNSHSGDTPTDDNIFGLIADDIEQNGYSIRHGALPTYLADALLGHQHSLSQSQFEEAGIGRGDDFVKTEFVRKDEICWINGESHAGQEWLNWANNLRVFLNRKLFLGLFSFESHFAHYRPGAYYKRHVDAFRGEANRVLSVVTYLNPGGQNTDGGELVLYQGERDNVGINVAPLHGTVVVFLSEEFPHEVLPATRDRFSVAGWFRVNASIDNRIDPPR